MADEARERRESPTSVRLTIRVIWSPSALREVARIFEYLVEFNPRAAAGVAAGLIAAGDSIATFTHRGRPVPNSDMRELVTSYPYVIRYRVARDAVRILRVRHTARRSTKP